MEKWKPMKNIWKTWKKPKKKREEKCREEWQRTSLAMNERSQMERACRIPLPPFLLPVQSSFFASLLPWSSMTTTVCCFALLG